MFSSMLSSCESFYADALFSPCKNEVGSATQATTTGTSSIETDTVTVTTNQVGVANQDEGSKVAAPVFMQATALVPVSASPTIGSPGIKNASPDTLATSRTPTPSQVPSTDGNSAAHTTIWIAAGTIGTSMSCARCRANYSSLHP